MTKPLLVGATAADPTNAIVIWNAIRRWFVEHEMPIEYALYSTYDAMGDALLAGELDIAWNAPMAHVQSLARSGGACRTLAMRDTDLDNHTVIIAKASSGIETVDDLRGARLALGVEISSELHVIPVAQLREADLDPLTECQIVELEPREYSDLKRWVVDFMIFDAVVAGDADAGTIFEPWLAHLIRKRGFETDDFVEVWRSRPFCHCAFTVRPGLEADVADRFVGVLISMDANDDPYVAEMMKLEHLKRWVKADDSGWDDLTAAVNAAGLVGKTF